MTTDELIDASPLARRLEELGRIDDEMRAAMRHHDIASITALTRLRQQHYELAQQLRGRAVADAHILGNQPMRHLGEQLGLSGQMVSVLRKYGPRHYVIIWRTPGGYVVDTEQPMRTPVRTRIDNGGIPVPSRYCLDDLDPDALSELDLGFWYDRLEHLALYTA